MPDDVGIVGGNGPAYGQQIGCMGQMLTGYDANGALWGWWCAGPLCGGGFPGDAGYWGACFPYCFMPQGNQPYFGAFRLPLREGVQLLRRATVGTTRSSGPPRT